LRAFYHTTIVLKGHQRDDATNAMVATSGFKATAVPGTSNKLLAVLRAFAPPRG
jgi:hypothetical protein